MGRNLWQSWIGLCRFAPLGVGLLLAGLALLLPGRLAAGEAASPASYRRLLGPTAVTAGPWLVRGVTESRLALRFVAPVDEAALVALPLSIAGRRVAAAAKFRVVADPRGREAPVIQGEWSFPSRLLEAGATEVQTVALGRIPAADDAGADPPTSECRLVRLPAVTAEGPVRVLLVSALAYPEPDQVTAFEARLGGPFQLAVWLGAGDGRRLGSGGWEGRIPVAIVAAPVDDRPLDVAFDVALGEPLDPPGLHLGGLFLATAADDVTLAGALGEPATWVVPILPRARWNLALGAAADHTGIAAVREVLALAARSRAPLVIAPSAGVGFISEPLRNDARGAVTAQGGGSRYAALPAGGQPASGLPSAVGQFLAEAGPAALVLERGALRLDPGDQGTVLEWQPPPLEVDQAGPGWGLATPAEAEALGHRLKTAWRAASSTAAGTASAAAVPAAAPATAHGSGPDGHGGLVEAVILDQAADQVGLLPRQILAKGGWEVLDLFQLAAPDGREPLPWERRLARRLIADPWFLGEEPVLLAKLPPWLQREALLRWMADPASEVAIWAEPLARSRDEQLIRAWLNRVERDPDPLLLGPGIRRLELQAAGTLPPDGDPVLQNRLTAAVFDSPLLSPTALRPIAEGLIGKYSPLGIAPAKRFLERQGRFRPVVDRL